MIIISTNKSNLVYKILFILPIGLAIIGSLFLSFFYHQIFDYSMVTGVSISIGIAIVIVFFMVLNLNIIRERNKNKRPPILKIGIHLLFSFLILTTIILGSWIVIPYANSVSYTTGPMITWASDQDPQTEITIMWRSKVPMSSILYYGPSEDNLNQPITVDEEKEWHIVKLEGLTPGEEYYYRVEGAKNSIINSFKTAPAIEEAFNFFVFSDPRQNSGPMGMLLQPNVPQKMDRYAKSNGIEPAFTVCCGDIVSEATDNAMWKSWYDDISVHSDLGVSSPIQIAIGNHERHDNCTGEIFDNMYPLESKPNYYYSYNYSSVHCLILDPWNYTSCNWGALDSTQLAWAEQDLQNSLSMKYKIIFMHPPPVKYGEVRPTYSNLVQLCDDYDVDAVFYGHDHSFGNWIVNDTEYFLIGVGGNNGGNSQPPGFCNVEVSLTELTVNMVWLNGTEVELAVISA